LSLQIEDDSALLSKRTLSTQPGFSQEAGDETAEQRFLRRLIEVVKACAERDSWNLAKFVLPDDLYYKPPLKTRRQEFGRQHLENISKDFTSVENSLKMLYKSAKSRFEYIQDAVSGFVKDATLAGEIYRLEMKKKCKRYSSHEDYVASRQKSDHLLTSECYKRLDIYEAYCCQGEFEMAEHKLMYFQRRSAAFNDKLKWNYGLLCKVGDTVEARIDKGAEKPWTQCTVTFVRYVGSILSYDLSYVRRGKTEYKGEVDVELIRVTNRIVLPVYGRYLLARIFSILRFNADIELSERFSSEICNAHLKLKNISHAKHCEFVCKQLLKTPKQQPSLISHDLELYDQAIQIGIKYLISCTLYMIS